MHCSFILLKLFYKFIFLQFKCISYVCYFCQGHAGVHFLTNILHPQAPHEHFSFRTYFTLQFLNMFVSEFTWSISYLWKFLTRKPPVQHSTTQYMLNTVQVQCSTVQDSTVHVQTVQYKRSPSTVQVRVQVQTQGLERTVQCKWQDKMSEYSISASPSTSKSIARQTHTPSPPPKKQKENVKQNIQIRCVYYLYNGCNKENIIINNKTTKNNDNSLVGVFNRGPLYPTEGNRTLPDKQDKVNMGNTAASMFFNLTLQAFGTKVRLGLTVLYHPRKQRTQTPRIS